MSLLHKLLLFNRDTQHSMSEETNIVGEFDKHTLLTKDKNLSAMIELKGVSYSSFGNNQQEKFLTTRNTFFKSIPSTISITVFQKRLPIIYNSDTELTNQYAKNILEVWEKNREGYETKYFISLTTKQSSLSSRLEKKRSQLTSEKQTQGELDFLKNKLEEVIKSTLATLKDYGARQLNSQEVLSFFATYANMEETTVNLKSGLLQDHYISANAFFKKDYIKHTTTKDTYTKFISIKSYDTEEIDSRMVKDLLAIRKNLTICEQIDNIHKDKAISKLNDKIRLSSEIVQAEIYQLKELVASDRETIIYYSLSILLSTDNLEELEDLAIQIKQLFMGYGIIAVIENINLKPLYFSFFPGKSHLNSRKRIITSMNASTLNYFEKDNVGYTSNSWGDKPLTVFQNQTGALHYFNLHNSEKQNALGHTLVVAESESGKTTLMSFLMMEMEKYNILRLAFDKLNGMYCMCNYLGGEYANINNMQLNPFSLKKDEENFNFLRQFLFEMANIKEDEVAEQNAINDTLNTLYGNLIETITFSDFMGSLVRVEGLRERFKPYINSIFDNEHCLMSFENSLNILGMDSILKDEKLSGLCAYYIFHKLKRVAEEKGVGFFIFVDELKDYIKNEQMAKNILERILESRKSNGVMSVAVQNLDFFDTISNRDSFLDNFAHYIIYPTKSTESLKKLKEHLQLSEAEIDFLNKTDPSTHQVLFKNHKTKESIFLDISLARLGKYLNVFNSSIQKVTKMKELQSNSSNWREEYLNG